MSHLIDLISHPFKHNSSTSSTAVIIITTALTTLLSITISRLVFKEKVKIIKSPVETLLPHLSQAEKDALPYPPDAFPGERDVDSPVSHEFGNILNVKADDYTVWHDKSV
jgi:hypothetical protein